MAASPTHILMPDVEMGIEQPQLVQDHWDVGKGVYDYSC